MAHMAKLAMKKYPLSSHITIKGKICLRAELAPKHNTHNLLA